MASITVGVSDLYVSNRREDTIITRALGSCIAVIAYDFNCGVGGILHYQLPSSRGHAERSASNPFMFADTGIPELLGRILDLGGRLEGLEVKLAGGSNVLDPNGIFDIGKNNYLAARRVLWKYGLLVKAEDIGGDIWRNVVLRMSDCAVFVESPNGQRAL